ncbi:hypothetical protein CDAR_393911 [Caerostris darwini]|uniref:Uncharacterized protein n=1 Tax=Caerostris darwini TaxID=1538125 RepID=A0AAV4TLQ8_9ARAC|nr:hypothetical protein CDAR_393911 [Caerostris darwini]
MSSHRGIGMEIAERFVHCSNKCTLLSSGGVNLPFNSRWYHPLKGKRSQLDRTLIDPLLLSDPDIPFEQNPRVKRESMATAFESSLKRFDTFFDLSGGKRSKVCIGEA